MWHRAGQSVSWRGMLEADAPARPGPPTPRDLPRRTETARLVLREPSPAEDARAVVDGWATDPLVTRYLLWPTYHPGAYSEAQEFLRLCTRNWNDGGGHRPWMMCTRDGGAPVGMLGITPGAAPHIWEVGYVLARAAWNHGYATEAVVHAVRLLMDCPSVWRLFAPTHADNLASQRVLAKAGFTREGTLRRYLVFPAFGPEPQDCSMWSLTRDDERARADRGASP
jgi:RimJ/RimL family protein N-acetyltransferase